MKIRLITTITTKNHGRNQSHQQPQPLLWLRFIIYNENMSILRRIFRQKREPEIIIQYGRLIDPVFTFYCQNNPDLKKFGWDKWTPPTKEEIDKRIKAYKEEWEKYNIVKEISNCLGLSFKRDVIDVYIVSGVSRSSSHPIIIKSSFTPKEFVVTLTHELIHRILTINKIPKVVFDPDESDTTNNHVIVFAVLKKILNEELWNINIKPSSKHPSKEYARALELAEEIGPDKVIKMMIG